VNLGTTITQLASSANCPGDSVTFSTSASGAGPFSYVWKKDNIVIPGATTNSISFPSVTASNAGTYTVEVTGAVTPASSTAILVVQTTPAITPLQSLSKCSGEPAIFSTIASGSGPFTYVWKRMAMS